MALADLSPSAAAATAALSARTWAPGEAFLTVLLFAAAWNGKKATPRIRIVDDYLHRSPLLQPLGEKGRIALRSAVIGNLSTDDSVSAACAAVPPEAARSLFAHVLDILIAVEPLNAHEEEFVAHVAQKLHIGAADAARIRDVITLKNSC